jgi:hypothetical protein
MIRIAISQAAFDAIASTLALGSVSFENQVKRGERYVWLAPTVIDRLRAMRGPGESYSDVILRFAAEGGRGDFRTTGATLELRPWTLQRLQPGLDDAFG